MATRLNTVEYAFETRIPFLAAATRHDFTAITVYIPETSSRTFVSAYVEITARDASTATASRASLSDWMIGVKFGAAAFNDVTIVDTMTDTGEQVSYSWKRDVTSRFTADFGTGASQTMQVGFSFGTSSSTNPVDLKRITAKLVITYSYDDTSATTRIKTVRIPLESSTGAVPLTTLTEIGTNQVPALDTFLPEASKSYRNIFFEVFANESVSATTTTTLNLALDSEAGVSTGTTINANNSSCFSYFIWVRDTMTTNVAHAFKAAMTGVAGCNNLCVVLHVTYEYNEASTTSVLNSIVIPWSFEDANLYNSTTYKSTYSQSFNLCEPGTLTLKQSGVSFLASTASTANQSCAISTQAVRTYTTDAGTLTAGQVSLIQRFDSGGAQGAGAVISSNSVTININSYSATLGAYTNTCGLIYLNYTSDKASTGGTGVHSKTIKELKYATAADNSIYAVGKLAACSIPEANYGIINTGMLMEIMSAATRIGINVAVSLESGEGIASGYKNVTSTEITTDNVLGRKSVYGDATNLFNRFTGDFDTQRAIISTVRYWKIDTTVSSYKSLETFTSYHGHVFQCTGNTIRSAGGSVYLKCFDSSTHECLRELTVTGNTSFNFNIFDPRLKYIVAYESATRAGRSADALPTRY